MRASLIATICFALVATASTLKKRQDELPACAQNCLSKAFSTTQPEGCTPDSTACLCKSEPYTEAVHECVMADCEESEGQAAMMSLIKLCEQNGVTLTPPAPTATPA